MPEREFCVSSDSLGVLGKPETWKQVYGFVDEMKNFAGLEAIGWNHLKKYLASETESPGVKIKGIHGRVSNNTMWFSDPVSKMCHATMNQILIPTSELTTMFPNVSYVLIHSSEAHNKKSELMEMNGVTNSKQTLFIENEPWAESLKNTAKQVEIFRQMGKNVGIMIDLGHHLFSLGGSHINLKRDWYPMVQDVSNVIESMKNNEDEKVKIGIHLPIGDEKNDAININQVTNTMWSDLSSLLEKYPQTLLVVENQQSGADLIYLTTTQAKKQQSRNQEKIGILIENGIIQE